MRLGIVLGAILMLAASCGTVTGTSFCDVYFPIPTSDETPETIQLFIDDMNIAYEEIC